MTWPTEGDFPSLILLKRGPRNLVFVIRNTTDINSFLSILKETLTLRAIRRIAARTKSQASSRYWFLYRRCVITGTIAKRIVSQNIKDCNNEKINRIITKFSPSNFTNEAMQYGTKNEENGLNAFFNIFKKTHINPRMSTTGLVLFEHFPFIGGSPDGLVHCDCCRETYLVEVKCPLRLAENGISSWKILEYFDENQNLKKTHNYYSQMTLYQGIMNIQTAYFVVYAKGEVIIRRIEFDKQFFDFQVKNLSEYYMKYYLPTIIGTNI